LNFTAGDIVPNSVQVGLPTAGANAGQTDITYDAFGQAGPTTEVLIDVVGYMVAGGAGTGATGATGPAGSVGPRGFSAWDAIPSGQTVTGSMIWDDHVVLAGGRFSIYVPFPGKATPAITSDSNVNFAPDGFAQTTDDDSACRGTVGAPTAPSGKVCIYTSVLLSVTSVNGMRNSVNGRDGFIVDANSGAAPGALMYLDFSWAYTAP